jgi:uncharacterized protein (TIGR03435 family)
MSARFTRAAVLSVCMSATALAQQPNAPPAFEVATVKVNTSGPGPAFGLMVLPGGRVFAQNVPLRDLIRAAYALEDSQVEGIPDSIRSARFDVEARAGAEVPIDTARAMTRTLLADRFRLVAHTETRQLPVYELVMARRDRTLGRGVRPAGSDCAPVTFPAGMPQAPPPPPGGGTALAGGGFECPSGLLPGYLSLRRLTMDAFAGILWRRIVQRPVFDRTGLSGQFDLDLTYLPELESINGRPASESPFLPAQITGAPSIFTAVQEQLGLKLDSTRGPVDVLVVDRVEPPTAN